MSFSLLGCYICGVSFLPSPSHLLKEEGAEPLALHLIKKSGFKKCLDGRRTDTTIPWRRYIYRNAQKLNEGKTIRCLLKAASRKREVALARDTGLLRQRGQYSSTALVTYEFRTRLLTVTKNPNNQKFPRIGSVLAGRVGSGLDPTWPSPTRPDP